MTSVLRPKMSVRIVPSLLALITMASDLGAIMAVNLRHRNSLRSGAVSLLRLWDQVGSKLVPKMLNAGSFPA